MNVPGVPAGPVDWNAARRVATVLANRQPPMASYELKAMQADFEQLTAEAEALVEAETGLRSLAGPARGRVTDRAGWVDANVASFQRLLRPVLDKLARAAEERKGLKLPVSIGRGMNGAQLGLLLGWMSGRVLGQYDQLLIEEEHPEDQDIVYYVGPNVAALERKYGFPPREFRLWLALHEVTHRAQFTGVPWMRDYFLGLVNETLDGFDPDPRQLLDALKRASDSVRAGRNPLEEGGMAAMFATPEQQVTIRRVSGLMSLLEGHGDVTMDRAATARIPNAATFSRTLHERRRQTGLAKAVSMLVGMDAKMRQYEQGERFIHEVEKVGGRDLLARVWEAPQFLPTWPEIRQPQQWIDRTAALIPIA